MPAYDANTTQIAKSAAIREIVTGTSELLKKSEIRTDLHDLDAVKAVTRRYMGLCSRLGVVPSVEGLSAALGISRRWLYQYLNDHPDEESAKFIDQFRTASTAIRIAAADRGAADATVSIFLLLNSNQGFTNNHQIELVQPTNPLDVSAGDVAAVRQRYLDALPDTENDYKENL